ncbi:MAG TPA: CrcB family protein [Solirubrobacteraceae bacterium]|nr:CrcB family protein [Solirubrobacteraceae bacterium]
MSLPMLLGIGVLGGLASIARLLVAAAVDLRTAARFPFGILLVNVAGAFALGLAAGAGLSGDAYRLLATGLLGAFTTFSTWMLDSRRLGRRLGGVNVVASLALGLAAVWFGRRVGAAL